MGLNNFQNCLVVGCLMNSNGCEIFKNLLLEAPTTLKRVPDIPVMLKSGSHFFHLSQNEDDENKALFPYNFLVPATHRRH